MSDISLYGKRISDTYHKLLQITGNTLYDGSGNTVNVNFNVLSAQTFFINGNDIYNVFTPIGSSGYTNIQNGINTFTSGTAYSPSINITALTIDFINVTGNNVNKITTLSANTITATTIIYNGKLINNVNGSGVISSTTYINSLTTPNGDTINLYRNVNNILTSITRTINNKIYLFHRDNTNKITGWTISTI